MSDSWEALPQRTRRRRSSLGCYQTAVSATGTAVDPVRGNDSAESGNDRRATEIPEARGWSTAGTLSGQGWGVSNDGAACGERGKESTCDKMDVQVCSQETSLTEVGASGAGTDGEEGREEEDGDNDRGEAMKAARHAAVASAIEEKSEMCLLAEGLDSRAGVDGTNFEYLDHTADVQLHSWGDSLERAMEAALEAMFNVMTDIARVDIDPARTREMRAKGHDAMSLLFALLDEFLFLFHSEGLVVKKATVHAVDRDNWKLTARAEGEAFDLSKHPQGTEVKAITYSNMQINEVPSGRTDIYVIVDI